MQSSPLSTPTIFVGICDPSLKIAVYEFRKGFGRHFLVPKSLIIGEEELDRSSTVQATAVQCYSVVVTFDNVWPYPFGDYVGGSTAAGG